MADKSEQGFVLEFPEHCGIGSVRLRHRNVAGVKGLRACAALCGYVAKRWAGRLQGLRVLDLNSTSAVTTIALVRLGANVTTITPPLEVLAWSQASANSLGQCVVADYTWGTPLHGSLAEPFDLVLGGVIMGEMKDFESLLDVLRAVGKQQQERPAILLTEVLCGPPLEHLWASTGARFIVQEMLSSTLHTRARNFDPTAPHRLVELCERENREFNLSSQASKAQCPRVQDEGEAIKALQEHGACIWGGVGTTKDAAALLPHRLFGAHLKAVPEPAEVSHRVLSHRGINKEDNFRAHTDGHAYGDLFPDCFLLVCARPCKDGGSNFLVDGYGVLDELAADPATAWVPPALEARAIDQTSRLPSVTPVVLRAPCGRRALRCRLSGPPAAFAAQRVAENSQNPAQDAAMLKAYHAAVERAASAAARVKLNAGDALIVDNYRMFHGRDPYADSDRLLWRVWVWTDGARGVPEGELYSTPGNAAGLVEADTPLEDRAKRARTEQCP